MTLLIMIYLILASITMSASIAVYTHDGGQQFSVFKLLLTGRLGQGQQFSVFKLLLTGLLWPDYKKRT